jgi:hypothetical protein
VCVWGAAVLTTSGKLADVDTANMAWNESDKPAKYVESGSPVRNSSIASDVSKKISSSTMTKGTAMAWTVLNTCVVCVLVSCENAAR